jgi:hypothetical protein
VQILPLIDFLILTGSASIGVGFVLKSIALTTTYRPTLLGFSSTDFVLIAGVCLGLALVLAARTWVKLNEPRLLAFERARRRLGIEAEADLERSWTGAGNGNGQRLHAGEPEAENAPSAVRSGGSR